MFDDKKYRIAGPTGGPGVLGPWTHNDGTGRTRTRHSLTQTGTAICGAIAQIARARALNC